MHIVLIDDEKILSERIREKLENHGYSVTLIENFQAFLEMKMSKEISLFLIDISLWDGSGIDVIKILRSSNKTKHIPAIFLSGHNETSLKVESLDLWWDDYIVKPFEFDELFARIRNALRKNHTTNSTSKIKVWDIVFDTSSRRVYSKGEEITLSKKEKQLLEFFMTHPDICIKKETLHNTFWESTSKYSISENTMNVTICNLRKKLWKNFYLKTIVWEWYCLYKKNTK